MKFEQWNGFKEGAWQEQIAVRDFINLNYTPYDGDKSFLAGPTERTKKVMEKVNKLLKKEMDKGGVLDVDTKHVSGLLAYDAGYIDKNLDIIVGFQTDEPLKRGVNPFGGIRMARQACEAYGYKLSDEIEENFKYSP
ncbi:MAG: formate acetyltransferase, partial [Clostridia bacterium]|nr:formate acetyltransferase [Clostridia bacterium]